MKIRQKITAVLLTVQLLITAGCNGENNSGGESSAPVTSSSAETIETQSSVSVETAYKYEQELNIIDDNCRNYYEIFVRSFYDSDGDGIGDLNGVTAKLDYIQNLGFNGIWLMPVNPSATYHKYDVKDYYDIDKEYGTLDDFKNLLSECEKRGIKVIMDLVLNHTSAQHQWFIEASNYIRKLGNDGEINTEDCKYAGYYNFKKGVQGSGWSNISGTDWYYECNFWDQMPDLNLDNEEVRREIEEIVKYWLDFGAGGFRLDAVKDYYTGKPQSNIEFLKWFCDYVRDIDENAYIVGEVWESMIQISEYYKSGITSIFNFPVSQHDGNIIKLARNMSQSGKTFPELMAELSEQYGASNPNYIDAPFVSNHDTGRIANACGNNETQMKLAAGLLLTMNGSPFVYYGEETGLNSYGSKDENKRLPMNWSSTDTAGLTRKPSDADTVEQKHAPADEQLKDPYSILNYYKRAIRIRNENPEIARGSVEVLATSNDSVSGVKKSYNGSEISIYYNLTDSVQSLSVSGEIRGYLSVDSGEPELSDGNLTMPPYSIVICK